ncbi:MAG: hypothetical protein L3J47_00515 [Sulfurovum sp.]|nr:hypothetical protein [Sulfurovum sp.]
MLRAKSKKYVDENVTIGNITFSFRDGVCEHQDAGNARPAFEALLKRHHVAEIMDEEHEEEEDLIEEALDATDEESEELLDEDEEDLFEGEDLDEDEEDLSEDESGTNIE